jgi:hypothetical protein
MRSRLYAVEFDGVPVTVRAEVVVPSREDRAMGDSEWVDFEAVNGVRVEKMMLKLSDEQWSELEEAVLDAHAELLAAEREERLSA